MQYTFMEMKWNKNKLSAHTIIIIIISIIQMP